MSTLSEITGNIGVDLADVSGVVWSPTELERAIRWALHELSWAVPRRVLATATAVERQYEYSLAAGGVTDALYLIEVWHPYSASAPERHPQDVAWGMLDDDKLVVDCEIEAGSGIRILYAAPHTIAGLDTASVTTLSREQEELVCMGAGGYAARQRALEAIGLINVANQAPILWQQWAERRLASFRERITEMGQRAATFGPAWVSWRDHWHQ